MARFPWPAWVAAVAVWTGCGGEPDPFSDYVLDPEVYATPPGGWVSETPEEGAPYSYASDQVLVLLAEGEPRASAEAAASAVGATVVGQIPPVGLYQLRLAREGAEAVSEAIDRAEAEPSVEAAFRNLRGQLFATCPAECNLSRRESSPDQCPYRESEYFETLTVLDNLSLSPSRVRIGIVDTGIRAGVSALAGYPLLNADSPGRPIPRVEINDGGTVRADDAHGTAVVSVMVARDGGGDTRGINGLASRMLSDRVELVWGGSSGPGRDPAVDAPGDLAGWLVSTARVARARARVVNMSFGWERGVPDLEKLVPAFARIFVLFPDTVFVVAAPSNSSYVLDGTNAAPAGIPLPNVITVGGTALCAPSEALAASTTGDRIDIAASGFAWTVNVRGGDPVTLQMGNSFAAPQVSSLVAVLRALDPGLSADAVKRSYVTELTFDTAPAVSGRRLAFSRSILQLMVDRGWHLDLLAPEDLGSADHVGLVITRICGGVDYRLSRQGSFHIGGDDVMGMIHESGFGFAGTPGGEPFLEMFCDQCELELADFPIGSDLSLPRQVRFGWGRVSGIPADTLGAGESGTLTVESCRVDGRYPVLESPVMVTIRGRFEGTMGMAWWQDEFPWSEQLEGAFNLGFAVGVMPPSPLIDDIETLCERGTRAR